MTSRILRNTAEDAQYTIVGQDHPSTSVRTPQNLYEQDSGFIWLNGRRQHALLDNQATASFVSLQTVQHLRQDVQLGARDFVLPDGSKARSIGTVDLHCALVYGTCSEAVHLFQVLSESSYPVILGHDILCEYQRHQARLLSEAPASTLIREDEALGIKVDSRHRAKRMRLLALPDMGANCNLVSKRVVDKLGIRLRKCNSPQARFRLGTGQTAVCLGTAMVPLRFEGQASALGLVKLRCFVLARPPFELVFGKRTLRHLKALSEHRSAFRWGNVDIKDTFFYCLFSIDKGGSHIARSRRSLMGVACKRNTPDSVEARDRHDENQYAYEQMLARQEMVQRELWDLARADEALKVQGRLHDLQEEIDSEERIQATKRTLLASLKPSNSGYLEAKARIQQAELRITTLQAKQANLSYRTSQIATPVPLDPTCPPANGGIDLSAHPTLVNHAKQDKKLLHRLKHLFH